MSASVALTLRASTGTADADVEDRLRVLEEAFKQSTDMSDASEGDVTEVRVSNHQQSTRLVNIPTALPLQHVCIVVMTGLL